ncbi:MAG: hypothetical protein HC910_21075 [Spirulinaceae cyanobacterium SM2_1_0]|nr:hypothetical protein [Spirulinaceae cyanobacterium SM2_1_0]
MVRCTALAIALLTVMALPLAPAHAQFRVDRPDFFEDGQRQFEQEIRRLEQQQSPSTAPTLTVETGEWRWSRVVLRDAGCAVWLPEGPLSQESESVATPWGEIGFTAIASHPPGARFIIAASEPLPAEILANPEDFLAQVRDRLLERAASFSLAGSREVDFKSYPARDFILNSASEQLTFRLLLANGRLYVLAASQPTEGVNLDAISAYFSSFELL